MIGSENHLEKKLDPKNLKNSKNHGQNAACEQKTTSEKAIFVQIPFSHSTLKLEQKIFTQQTTRFFAPLPVSGVTKIITPI